MTRTTYDTSYILYQGSIPIHMHADVTYVQSGVYTLLHAHMIKGDTNCRCCVKIFAVHQCLTDWGIHGCLWVEKSTSRQALKILILLHL